MENFLIVGFICLIAGAVIGWQAKKRKVGKRLNIFFNDVEAKAKRAANSGLNDAEKEIKSVLNTARKHLK